MTFLIINTVVDLSCRVTRCRGMKIHHEITIFYDNFSYHSVGTVKLALTGDGLFYFEIPP